MLVNNIDIAKSEKIVAKTKLLGLRSPSIKRQVY